MINNSHEYLTKIKKIIYEEKKISIDIYNSLKDSYDNSVNKFHENDNIIGIFFVDLLKLFTQFALKKYEIKNHLYIEEFYSSKIQTYPYISYLEVEKNDIFNKKNYGKKDNINKRILKYWFIFFLNIKNFFKKRKSIYLTGDGINFREIISLSKLNFKIILLSKTNKIYIEDYNKQIDNLLSEIKEISKKLKILEDIEAINETVCLHIESFMTSKKIENRILKNDSVLVLGSGNEIFNRFKINEFKKSNLKTIHIAHGYASGVLDEPIWGELGDIYRADYLIGYGSEYLKTNSNNEYIKLFKTKYYHRNAYFAKAYNDNNRVKLNKKRENIYYFPTSLRGDRYRYGPFTDIPDKIYIEWQEKISELFQNKIIFKEHPKEKYKFLYNNRKASTVDLPYSDIKNDVDIFIFDYWSTIFAEACATDKPIIYLDIGIRNLSSDALTNLKKRVIYYNILSNGFPTLEDIKRKIKFYDEENFFSKKYSFSKKVDPYNFTISKIISNIL